MHSSLQTKTVAQSYQALIESGTIESDPAQRALAARLDALLDALRQRKLSAKSSSLGWLFGRKQPAAPRGLYIHGSVGRGKSMLMDLFFALAPGDSKRRVHFNDFMLDAHERIHAHRKAYERGEVKEADPIGPVGKALAGEAQLLCFDEFAVTDIADAMVLGRLFSVMFEEQVTVVATSNVEPRDLYRDGLNRQRFVPFIEMLTDRLDLFELDARTDFRLEKTSRHQAYLSPLNEKNAAAMASIWKETVEDMTAEAEILKLRGRKLEVERAASGDNGRAAWFNFEELCVAARSAEDYLAIARQFDTVFIEGVPMMDLSMRNQAKRFILLIDTLYDCGTATVISAAASPHALYHASTGNEVFEFQRTASRLIEMQSHEYAERNAARSGTAS